MTSAEDLTAEAWRKRNLNRNCSAILRMPTQLMSWASFDAKADNSTKREKIFEAALKNSPNFEEAHLGLASVLLSLQKPELALPHLHAKR